MKNIRLGEVSYQMLVELGKKNRPSKNPDKMMDLMIQERYNKQ